MSQIQKLDSLIVKIIKEELDELTVPSKDGKLTGVTNSNSRTQAQKALQRGETVDFVDPTKMKKEENEEEMQDTQLESMPTGTEIAGQVAEIVEKLKAMSEGSDDPKKRKLAEKIVKQMQSAKAALEALTAHEVMLEEKDQEKQTKAAEKHRDRIEKIFKGIVKDENIVNRLKDKLSAEDIVTLTKKLKDKGKELDEEKLARIVLNRSLKEGWSVKKKVDTEQLDEGFKEIIATALITLASMTPAKAQQTASSIASNVPKEKVSAMTQDIKAADNKAELTSVIKSYSDDTEDIKIDANISKPSGYVPLTVQQREDWNEYLNSLGKEAGSPELDKGVPTAGRQKLDAYLKANPNSSLNNFQSQDALIKSIQYEMQVMRRGDNASDLGLDPVELKAMQNLLLKTRKPFMMVNRSKMDGNPGQFTTQEYYPVFGGVGTDYKKAIPGIYKTLVLKHNIKDIDGQDISKPAK